MKYVIVILPLVLSALNVFAIKLEHVPMDQMIFDVQPKNRVYRDWIITKIPSKSPHSITDYRLDIKINKMDRKKFNFYNFRFYGDRIAPFNSEKTYKTENFLPNFLMPKSMPKSNPDSLNRLPETSTLASVAHWMEWRTGNQKGYLKDSLNNVPSADVSPELFDRLVSEFGQEVNPEKMKTGDVVVIYGTDDIDQIQMPLASYLYVGNGIVLESKKSKNKNFSKFVYLKDIQSHFKNRLMDYRIKSLTVLTKKPLYLSEYVKNSKEQDINLDRQAAKVLGNDVL
ncbi:MAG: hypothetical protein B7Y39_13865 [Bdellovibrio sp. 28-41-41]|nr:MAG: hypothetical protein B7Y39_13865 [Bdellovibrio sp. 28-41-41]